MKLHKSEPREKRRKSEGFDFYSTLPSVELECGPNLGAYEGEEK